MGSRRTPDGWLGAAWREHGAAVPRSIVHRHRTERTIQTIRIPAAVLCVLLTYLLDGGPGGVLWLVAAIMLVNLAVTEALLRRPPTPTTVGLAGAVSFSLDTLGAVLTLIVVATDPTDPIVALATILALEAAVRWQVPGGLLGGALGAALTTGWMLQAHMAATGGPPPGEYLLFAGSSVLLIAGLVGGVIRHLDHARHRVDTLLVLSPELIATVDRTGALRTVNAAAMPLLGFDPLELSGRAATDLVEDPAQLLHALATPPGRTVRLELAFRHRDGHRVWLELSLRRDATEGVAFVIGRDTTARRQAERARSESEQRYRALFTDHLDAVLALDDQGRLVDVNPAACALHRTSREALLGTAYIDLLDSEHAAGAARAVTQALAGRAGGVEVLLAPPGGELVHADLDLLPITVDGEVVGVFCTARDVTERKRREALLEYRAGHDVLTGLANRSSLLRRAEERLATPDSLGLLFLDLDGFKAVNDRHGHATGDQVLVTIARRLQTTLRGQDLVCRLGGDEFCVLLSPATPALIHQVGARVREVVRQPIVLAGSTVSLDTSVGGAIARRGETAEQLLARADAAMYTVKSHHRLGVAGGGPAVLLAT